MNISILRKLNLIFIIIIIFGCQKSDKKEVLVQPVVKSVKKEVGYIKSGGENGFYTKDDIFAYHNKSGKKNRGRLDFGAKVTINDTFFYEADEYVFVEVENGKKYWVNRDMIVDGFVVITKQDTATFRQPDNDYITDIKLQPGDMGFITKVYDGFVNVDFRAYRTGFESEEKVWVGNKWVEEGTFITDVKAAKQGLYLYNAYYNIEKGSISDALNNLNQAKKVTDKYVEVNKVITNLIAALEKKDELSQEVNEDVNG